MGSREDILAKIQTIKANKSFPLIEEPDWEEESLMPIVGSLVDVFKDELEAVSGECILADSESEIRAFLSESSHASVVYFSESLKKNIPKGMHRKGILEADVALIECDALIARMGSVLVSSSIAHSRQIQVFPPHVIVVARESDLVPYLSDGLDLLKQRYAKDWPSQVSLITGPSRTADIEKTLVLGAHGPKQLTVFIQKHNE